MRAITKDTAEKVLKCFRAAPGSATTAAKHSGVTYRTARKAWLKGLRVAGHPNYRRPFEQIIHEEQMEARARMVNERATVERLAAEAEAKRLQSVRLDIIKDKTDTRIAEGELARRARTTTSHALGALALTGAGVAKVSVLVRKALESLVVIGDSDVVCVVQDPIAFQKERSAGGSGYQYLRAMGLPEAKGYTKTLATFATALRQVNDAAQKALEMERLLLGEPTKILGIQHLETMTMDEAERHVEAASRAFKRLQDKGEALDGSPIGSKLH